MSYSKSCIFFCLLYHDIITGQLSTTTLNPISIKKLLALREHITLSFRSPSKKHAISISIFFIALSYSSIILPVRKRPKTLRASGTPWAYFIALRVSSPHLASTHRVKSIKASECTNSFIWFILSTPQFVRTCLILLVIIIRLPEAN